MGREGVSWSDQVWCGIWLFSMFCRHGNSWLWGSSVDINARAWSSRRVGSSWWRSVVAIVHPELRRPAGFKFCVVIDVSSSPTPNREFKSCKFVSS